MDRRDFLTTSVVACSASVFGCRGTQKATVDDCISIAAIFSCILRMLYRLRTSNQRWRNYASMLIAENRWRAQRYGIDSGLVDFAKSEVVEFEDLIEELIDLTAEDADALGCTNEVRNLRKIIKRGTSAHQQLATYQTSLEAGNSNEQALKDVVDFLIKETMAS